ncbi:MAG: hypothetical protein E7Y34_02380, partial [Mycoplasma sp.]|nr:hypothetical protein [Mycoplasma sp.]
MLSSIRFWTSKHSEKALYHDRNFTYYYDDILNKKESFINSSSENDIRVIPKFNNNQVEMSFIVSHSQLLKLQQNNNFNITKNVLFCFLPLIEFKDFQFDTNSKYKLEFWRVIDWEHIYFPPKDKSKILEQNGSLTIYARKDVIYTNKDELNPAELFINRSTDFVPTTENLQLCSPVCAYGAEVKKEVYKSIVKTYDREIKNYETVFAINTSDATTARKYFSNFSQFWVNWVRDIIDFVPNKSYGDYITLLTFWPSFRGHFKFGTTEYKVDSGEYNYELPV